MRTDVRIGLAVGAILLAVLIAYVLVVPPIQQQQLSRDDSPPAAPERRRVTALADAPAVSSITPAPVAQRATEAKTRSVTTAPATSQPAVALASPSPTPSPAPVSSSVSGIDRNALWDQALSSGRVPVAVPPRLPSAAASRRDGIAQTPTGSASLRAGVTNPGSAGAPGTHVVRRGETLSAIAHMAYGNASLYPAIVRANPGINPHRLRPGQVLRLPASPTGGTATQLPSIDADLVIASATPAPAPAPAGGTIRPAVSSRTSYRVQPGENLHRIAAKLYGSSSHWRKIYDANRETIGPNPGLLRANVVLKLPEVPSVTLAQ